ncbi:MAG TPA: hypothetical protein VFO60_01620 [Candidatus Dormibacteraeota bacterium]|nr:hypothetical protein [Candidatus Dormibacteraeota bacterium]
MTEARRERRWRPPAIAAVGALGVAVLLTMPAAVTAPSADAGGSERVGLEIAARQDLHWGSQIVSASGPLGFLQDPTYWFLAQWATALAGRIAVHLLLAGAVVLFLVRRRASPPLWVLTAVCLVLPSTAVGSIGVEGPAAVALLYLAALDEARPRRAAALACAAGAASGAMSLVTATDLALALALAGVFALLSARDGRPVLGGDAGVALAAGFVGWWLLSDQSIAELPSYLRGAFEIVAGAAGDATGGLDLLTLTAWVLGAGCAVAAAVLWRARDAALARLLTLFLPLLLVSLEESAVRADPSHRPAVFSVALLVATLAIVEIAARRGPRAVDRRPLAWAAAALCVATVAAPVAGAGGPAPAHVRTTADGYLDAWHLVTSASARAAERATVMAVERGAYPVPAGALEELQAGTVDVVPADLAIVYAYDLPWAPRPLLQSTMASTPSLDQRDADHFAGSDAPDRVLLGADAVFDEPATFRQLLSSYAARSAAGAYLLLVRRPAPPSGQPRDEGTRCSALDQDVPVPHTQGRYTYASVTVDEPLAVRVERLLGRPQPLSMRMTTGSGEASPWHRLTSGTSSDGILVEAPAASPSDLAELFAGVVPDRTASLRIGAQGSGDGGATVCLRFFSLPAPAR